MNYKNIFGGAKNIISEKKLSNILKKHPFEKASEENNDVKEVEKSAQKKRKSMVPEQTETAGTKRLKKLKDVSNEDQNEEKITVKLSKGAKASPQKKTISYEEQAANYANSGADKLDAFKFTDNGSKKAEANKFKFVDDTEGPKKNKTLDDWKQKADAKTTTTTATKTDVKPKAPETQEKQTVIDPKAYFAMFTSGQKPKKSPTPEVIPVPQPQVEKEKDAIEIEVEQQEEQPLLSEKSNSKPLLPQDNDVESQNTQKNNENETTQGHVTTQETQNYVPTTQDTSTRQETLSQNPKPFAGLSFGVVGEMNSVTQKELISILESLGAEITDDIDEYVWGLVVGSCLEDGRDVQQSIQYDMAIQNDVKIYTEIEFDEYLLKETGKNIEGFLEKKQPEKTPAKPTPKTQIFSPAPAISLPMNMAATPQPQPDRMQIENKNTYRPLQPAKTPQNNQPQQVKQATPASEKLWTDKHAPTSIADIIGNQDIVRNLMMWLKDWDDVHLQGNKKTSSKFDGRKGKDAWAQSNVNAKGCLVSGPPGIGKTTSVRLIARHMGYEVIEQNASDVRNKIAVEGLLNHLTDNTLVNFSKQKASTNKKFLILMDEVDGMSSGDRGGNQVLINAIKNTKAPIICVCNDRQHQKVRSLANHCYDLRFQKPPKRNVAQRLAEIGRKEKLNIDMTALEYLCESFGNDIRQTVNYLQLHAKRSNTLTFNDAKESLTKSSKDRNVMMGNFEAAKLLLSGTHELQLREKIDLFFIDYDMIPLLVHENYLPNGHSASAGDLEWIAKSSSYIADGDILCQSVKKNGEWGLLPNYAFLGAVYPCDIMCTQVQWPKFPEWLGKNSSQRKKTREVREIRALTAPESLADFSDILFDCAQSYLDIINFNLQTNDKAGVETVVDILDSYNLTPEILKEHLVDIQISSNRDPFAGISTQTKTLLTKTYNAKHKSSVKATKPKKNVGGGESEGGLKRFSDEADDAEMSDGEDNNDDSVENEEDKIEIEPVKPTAAPKSSKKSKKGK